MEKSLTNNAAKSPPATRKRFGWLALLIASVLGALVAGGIISLVANNSESIISASAEQYHCPMHPSVVQDHPGNCPICGMKLVKVGNTESSTPTQRHVAFYRSPMDPKQTSPMPRKDEMGMDYIAVYEDEVGGPSNAAPDMAVVGIDPERQQLIGLTTAEVRKGAVGGAVRTVGRVSIDETRVRHVNIKNGGFVEKVFVDYLGKPVKKGDPLFTLFSPELLAAQEEFLLAKRTQDSLKDAPNAGGQSLLAAAQRRLSLWDVSEKEMKRLAETGEPSKTLTIYSPASGVVTKKDVVDGMKLEAGAMPYEIVDLSNVWVLADIYESELRFVKNGTPATLTLKAYPGRTFTGKTVFVDPLMDSQSRTVKVRLNFPNAAGELRPEMFGEVVLQLESRDAMVVPTDAIIDSGTSKVVFVAQSAGKFAPRVIEIGQASSDTTEVTKGLSFGERVVTRANFLLDSESRLRASLNDISVSNKPESARVLPSTSLPVLTDSKADAVPTHKGHEP